MFFTLQYIVWNIDPFDRPTVTICTDNYFQPYFSKSRNTTNFKWNCDRCWLDLGLGRGDHCPVNSEFAYLSCSCRIRPLAPASSSSWMPTLQWPNPSPSDTHLHVRKRTIHAGPCRSRSSCPGPSSPSDKGRSSGSNWADYSYWPSSWILVVYVPVTIQQFNVRHSKKLVFYGIFYLYTSANLIQFGILNRKSWQHTSLHKENKCYSGTKNETFTAYGK